MADGAAADTWPFDEIDGFLIDLDGTVYSPSGPIPGADDFYATLLRHRPHVFLSNTGAKGSDGVQAKLAKNGLMMQAARVPFHIYTATQAQVHYMIDNIPHGARLFVIAGGDADGVDSYWRAALRRKSEDLVQSWDMRTRLSDTSARDWAAAAAAGQPVYVALFSDGSISAVTDPVTGEVGFADWSYDVIKKCSFILSHGAELIATAEDAFNPSTDFMPLPGPGMFCAMFRKLLHPLGEGRIHVCGKGGNEGAQYMMEPAIEMLRAQGASGDRRKILSAAPLQSPRHILAHMLGVPLQSTELTKHTPHRGIRLPAHEHLACGAAVIGDRFDTDMRAGVFAGIRTCLVESGCHSIALQPHFPEAPADFYASSIMELLPPQHHNAHSRSFESVVPLPPRRRPTYDDDGLLPKSRSLHDISEPPPIRRNTSGGSSASSTYDLRAWRLGRGNLVYAAGESVSQCTLITVLRTFFEERANGGDAISATDAMEAMSALGISPPTMSDGRSLHELPFDVTNAHSRVTFAALCRVTLRALEVSEGHTSSRGRGSLSGGRSPGAPLATWSAPWVAHAPSLFQDDGSAVIKRAPSPGSSRASRDDSPFTLRSSFGSASTSNGRMRRVGNLSTIASDSNLETLDRRWLDAEQQRALYSCSSPSRALNALIDRR